MYQHNQSAPAAPATDEQFSDAEQDAAATPTGDTSAKDDKEKACKANYYGKCFFGNHCRYSHDPKAQTPQFVAYMKKDYPDGKFTGKTYTEQEAKDIIRRRQNDTKKGKTIPKKTAAPAAHRDNESDSDEPAEHPDPYHDACAVIGIHPCAHYYINGSCRFGERCRLSHNEKEEISLSKLKEMRKSLERKSGQNFPKRNGKGKSSDQTP